MPANKILDPLTMTESAKAFTLRKVVDYVAADPVRHLPQALDVLDALDRTGVLAPHRRAVRTVIDDPSNNWNRLMRSLWEDIDPDVLKTFLENVVVNASLIGYPKQQAVAAEHDCNVPWAILVDPTSACNLRCTGCWAADYGAKLNLTFANGTLIDEEFADALLRVKNFMPAISVEGFEAETDDRRGAGTFAATLRAMELLRERRLPFGASCCYTSKNTEVIGSEAYFDFLVEQGAKFAWFFTYMPVGENAAPELIARPEQRAFMYRQVRRFRDEKPLFTIDFWNDGDHIGGCVAGGRAYCHINANGDVEPCAFVHYADSNIREKTLLEAYRSPLFKAYRAGQPFNENHYRPCPLLDNEGALATMVEASGAHSTDLESPEDVRALTGKCACAASCWKPVADELWEERTGEREVA